MTNEKAERRALFLLAAGSLIGVLLGVVTAAHRHNSATATLPDGAIASVNGKPIREEDYTRAVALVERDKRTEVTDEDRTRVLDRLIEEELLVQRGIAVGLVGSDRSVRKAITQAMLASIAAESAGAQPSADELRTFYADNPSLFAGSAGTAIEQGVATETTGEPPTFADVQKQVEATYLQHSRDDALRTYLEWLRGEAKIIFVPEARE
ncbi:MAG TPA: SurA N-terminal domain-containing protein [Candidatus Binatia bacterium]|nr:SurA N-terminal domain-containing protein [Candidatus Binatia bacterium]